MRVCRFKLSINVIKYVIKDDPKKSLEKYITKDTPKRYYRAFKTN